MVEECDWKSMGKHKGMCRIIVYGKFESTVNTIAEKYGITLNEMRERIEEYWNK